MTRRRKLLIGMAGVVVLAAGTGTGLVLFGADDDGGTAGAAEEAAPTVEKVQRTNLTEFEELGGTLGYGSTSPLSLAGQGTITALPAAGTVLDRGTVVAEVNGLGIPLFLGDRPLWRPLQEGVTDGPDVEIIEANLKELGFAGSSTVKVDQVFTAGTAKAIAKWQKARGLPDSGVLLPGDVVVQPHPVRVAEVTGATGSPAGGPIMNVSGTERRVELTIAASRQGLLAVGDAVSVELPDDTKLPGQVAEVGTVITPGNQQQGTSPSFEVVVALDDPTAAGTLDAAPVKVAITKTAANDVLAVPVRALLALSEGGYAVERVTGVATELVAVKIGAFADGLVEVQGDLAEGDEVVVPG